MIFERSPWTKRQANRELIAKPVVGVWALRAYWQILPKVRVTSLGPTPNAHRASCRVRMGQLFLQKCAHAHEDKTYVLPHVNLYLLMRHERSYHFAPPWPANLHSLKTDSIHKKESRGGEVSEEGKMSKGWMWRWSRWCVLLRRDQ